MAQTWKDEDVSLDPIKDQIIAAPAILLLAVILIMKRKKPSMPTSERSASPI